MTAIILTGVRSFTDGKSNDITLGVLGLAACLLENELGMLLGF